MVQQEITAKIHFLEVADHTTKVARSEEDEVETGEKLCRMEVEGRCAKKNQQHGRGSPQRMPPNTLHGGHLEGSSAKDIPLDVAMDPDTRVSRAGRGQMPS